MGSLACLYLSFSPHNRTIDAETISEQSRRLIIEHSRSEKMSYKPPKSANLDIETAIVPIEHFNIISQLLAKHPGKILQLKVTAGAPTYPILFPSLNKVRESSRSMKVAIGDELERNADVNPPSASNSTDPPRQSGVTVDPGSADQASATKEGSQMFTARSIICSQSDDEVTRSTSREDPEPVSVIEQQTSSSDTDPQTDPDIAEPQNRHPHRQRRTRNENPRILRTRSETAMRKREKELDRQQRRASRRQVLISQSVARRKKGLGLGGDKGFQMQQRLPRKWLNNDGTDENTTTDIVTLDEDEDMTASQDSDCGSSDPEPTEARQCGGGAATDEDTLVLKRPFVQHERTALPLLLQAIAADADAMEVDGNREQPVSTVEPQIAPTPLDKVLVPIDDQQNANENQSVQERLEPDGNDETPTDTNRSIMESGPTFTEPVDVPMAMLSRSQILFSAGGDGIDSSSNTEHDEESAALERILIDTASKFVDDCTDGRYKRSTAIAARARIAKSVVKVLKSITSKKSKDKWIKIRDRSRSSTPTQLPQESTLMQLPQHTSSDINQQMTDFNSIQIQKMICAKYLASDASEHPEFCQTLERLEHSHAQVEKWAVGQIVVSVRSANAMADLWEAYQKMTHLFGLARDRLQLPKTTSKNTSMAKAVLYTRLYPPSEGEKGFSRITKKWNDLSTRLSSAHRWHTIRLKWGCVVTSLFAIADGAKVLMENKDLRIPMLIAMTDKLDEINPGVRDMESLYSVTVNKVLNYRSGDSHRRQDNRQYTLEYDHSQSMGSQQLITDTAWTVLNNGAVVGQEQVGSDADPSQVYHTNWVDFDPMDISMDGFDPSSFT